MQKANMRENYLLCVCICAYRSVPRLLSSKNFECEVCHANATKSMYTIGISRTPPISQEREGERVRVAKQQGFFTNTQYNPLQQR
jgi:hypothetical protein